MSENLFKREEQKGIDKLEALKTNIDNLQQEKQKAKTVEETHKRQTFLIDNEILKRFNKVAKKKGRGYKTLVINSILDSYLKEVEGEDE